MSALFAPGAPRLWSIPPGANFLDELAHTLAAATGLGDDPMALADALVYVPNTRSREALGFALVRASGRGACLLPEIRALGDLESEAPPPAAEAALADLPPVMPAAQRIGGLARLVLAYYHGQGLSLPAVSALAAARELAALLDQAALSGEVDWSGLDTLVEDRDMARHWRQSLDFLKIITRDWPVKLDEATAMDPYGRRYAAAEAVVDSWHAHPPQGPVIIAGSTGATPASRLLMQATLGLPQGVVVLPGLDRHMPGEAVDALEDAPSHPQFALARTLRALGVAAADVAIWPGRTAPDHLVARRRLIHEALAPADQTSNWTTRLAALAPDGNTARFVSNALEGLTLIETDDDSDEALAAALLLRETLETSDQTAALVTPDAGLARHVSALLAQWSIDVVPSAGLPLLQSAPGSFAFLIMDWLCDPSHPVKLMAVLNDASCGLDRAAIATLDRHFLRGPRAWSDLGGLTQHLAEARREDRRKYADYTDADIITAETLLSEIVACLTEAGASDPLPETITGRAFYEVATRVLQALAAAPAPWASEGSGDLSALIGDLCEITDALGPQPAHVLVDLYKAEATAASVRRARVHPRLAIWGPLEARLQSADRIILAGLNEGIWPALPAADAFLPRAFRAAIGLSSPDERVGLSAHDFAQLAAAPNVTLLTSRRRDDKPVVASRWIWRLRTLTRGALSPAIAAAALAPAPGRDPRDWIAALEAAPALPDGFTAEPRPTPPIAARPPGLSVTRIETLVRDPYAIYAQYVLGLNRLDPLNLPADVRLRGTAIHAALEAFETLQSETPADTLLGLIEAQLRAGGESEAELIAMRERRREVVGDYLAWRSDTAHQLAAPAITEQRGVIDLMVEGRAFRLSGTADRIEKRQDGSVAILDFKTGAPPSEAQVRSGLSPQMPLQGLIVERGGFSDVLAGRVAVSALTYLQFGSRFDVREIGAANSRSKLDDKPVSDIIAEAEQGLLTLLRTFADPDHPYLSAPRPQRVKYWSDYTRLARRDEWAGMDHHD